MSTGLARVTWKRKTCAIPSRLACLSSFDLALFVIDKAIDVTKYLDGKRRGPEILVTKMFYKPTLRVPEFWEFDEDTFLDGMPIKVVNPSRDKHYTISFFRFRTTYKEGKRAISEDHSRILMDKTHKNYPLKPGHSVDFSLPWKAAAESANQSRRRQVSTRHVGDHTFTLNFHDDFDNLDYESKPLDPFLVRSEGSRKVHKW